MKSLGVRLAVCAGIVCLLGVIASCSHQSVATTTAVAKKHGKPGPEESFETIMDTFRRRMEETPVLFVVNNPNGRTSMTGTNKVSSKLVPPASPDEPYKATITVKSESRYSVKVSETPEDAGHEKSGNKSDRLIPDKDKKGSDSFDPSFAKGASDASKSAGATTHPTEQVLPHTDIEEHKYDLLYQDGRWVLVTELNKETEQAIQNAFKSGARYADVSRKKVALTFPLRRVSSVPLRNASAMARGTSASARNTRPG